jgi:RNA polymerase sigma-70 factor (ECF subfamily)
MGDKAYQILLSSDDGFKHIFELFYPRIWCFVKEYIKDEQNAKDIMQNILLTLWEKRNSLMADTNLNAYLFSLAKSQCLNHLKHLKVVEKYSKTVQSDQQETQVYYYSMNMFEPEQMDIESLELMVDEAIKNLPEQCRKIFELNRYEGLKYKEIAQKLELSVKKVEAHISNALRLLRIALKNVV